MLKKFIALLLGGIMLFSAISCTGNTQEPEATTAATEATVMTTAATTNDTTQKKEPQEFYVGYARADISPKYFPVPNDNADATSNLNNIYATVVAVSDGEHKALFISLDTLFVMGDVLAQTLAATKSLGIRDEYVFINCTHNHSSVRYNRNTSGVTLWLSKYKTAIKTAITEALDDLSPATAEIGRSESDNLAFVRRYYMNDGSVRSIAMPTNSSGYAKHETEADPEMQVIRFNREGKKDVVMANWQAHAAHAVGDFPTTINADFVHFFREGVEEKYDVLFAYYQGACANINLNSYIHGANSFIRVGQKLVDVLGDALENSEPATLGKINAEKIGFTSNIDHSKDGELAKAQNALEEYNTYYSKTGSNMTNDMIYQKFGYNSKYHITSIIRKAGLPKTVDLPISAISFGDISFAAAPYEMFDTNGMYIKENSQFKTTFVCAYTNGHFGYIASELGYKNGGYEAYISRFEAGTGELVANKLVEMLNKQYNAN